jgi:hypothetical protein
MDQNANEPVATPGQVARRRLLLLVATMALTLVVLSGLSSTEAEAEDSSASDAESGAQPNFPVSPSVVSLAFRAGRCA